jgi:hypothetical protein
MGKKQRSILKVGEWSIYPILFHPSKPDQQGYCGVLIRITNRKKGYDVEVYNQLGERVKCRPVDFINGKVNGGTEQAHADIQNRIIEGLKVRIAEYIAINKHFNKELIMRSVYPSQFVNNHRKKRTKYVTIPITLQGRVVDSYQLEKQEVKELITPLLSKQTFINASDDPIIDGKPKTITGIFDSETGESMIESIEDFEHIVASEKYDKDKSDRIAKMTPIERYNHDEYDKSNIFHVVGQILYLYKNPKTKKPYTKNWKMAIMKLFDYRSRFKPKQHVSDLSVEWIEAVITAIKDSGYSTAHPKHFNVFKYDPNIFVKSKIGFYNDLSLEKFIKNLKEVFRYLIDEEKLPFIKIDKISYEDFNLVKVTQTTKTDFYLYKEEFDKLFYFEFKKDKNYSVEQLSTARDLFILQTYLGGLRPNELYTRDGEENITILDEGNGLKKVHYYISKDGKSDNENPICTYADAILKKYNYNFQSVLIEYSLYCKLLKAIAMQVFDRVIIKTEERDGKKKKLKLNIKNEFESYFARRTFQKLLKDIRIVNHDIKAFTGHKTSDVQDHYIPFWTIQEKREVMDSIKPEKSLNFKVIDGQ